MNVSHNQLISLPENLPPTLKRLSVSHNKLTSLPENLPSTLRILDVSNNKLTSLPENLPPTLKKLNVSYNKLASLSENLSSIGVKVCGNSSLGSLPNKTVVYYHENLYLLNMIPYWIVKQNLEREELDVSPADLIKILFESNTYTCTKCRLKLHIWTQFKKEYFMKGGYVRHRYTCIGCNQKN